MATNKSQRRHVGAHLSAAGGVEKVLARAADIGCNCVQVFSGSPRVWAKPDLEKVAVDKISSVSTELNVTPIFTHALYLVNLASDTDDLVKKSQASLRYELEFDNLVGGAGVVVHLGSHQGRGFAAVRDQLVATIDAILANTPPSSTLLIENAASRNGKIGGDLAEIAFLLNALEKQSGWVGNGRVGWCFDTCHAWAAGYYLGNSPPKVEGSLLPLPAAAALQAIESLNLLPALKLVHVNGSRDPFASNRDRHANFGEGELPLADIATFVNSPLVRHLPLVTEVPGEDGSGPDQVNINRLLSILE